MDSPKAYKMVIDFLVIVLPTECVEQVSSEKVAGRSR